MSVEQTTQLIQLILNSVLLSVACALIISGLTLRHNTVRQHVQNNQQPPELLGRLSQIRLMRHLHYRYRLSRYSVLSGYYALLFAILSCFTLVLRGMIEWNGLIPLALGCFVLGVATLLVAVGLMLIDWHLSDRALIDEARQLLGFGLGLPHSQRRSRRRTKIPMLKSDRQKMRVS